MAIVVGYVATPEGRAALRRAGEEALLRHVDLVVVETAGGRDADAAEVERLAAVLESVRAEVAAAGSTATMRPATPGDDPADSLIRAAEEAAAEVLVVGLRRRTPVGKLFLGSNAQRVLLEAPCPVLAVKSESG